jgi:hypothetical protein
MGGRIKAGSERDEMVDAVFHQTGGGVGKAPGRLRRRKAVLCIEASCHVAGIPYTSLVRMSAVGCYLGSCRLR